MADTLNIILRPATITDMPYIRQTWLHSYQDSKIGHELGDRFESHWRPLIDRLTSTAQIVVACRPASASEPDAEHLIVGWLCFDPVNALLHYLYVRGPLQGYGVARVLLAGLELKQWTATHQTACSMRIISRWKLNNRQFPWTTTIDPRHT